MCLYTKNLKPYVAKEDIKVYKILKKTNGEYITPYQNTKVSLGSVMNPYTEIEYRDAYYGYDNCTLRIKGGCIHAVTSTIAYDKDIVKDVDNYIVVEAYIPKGVKFYFSDDFVEVAAKELYITDNIVDNYSKLSDEEIKVLLLTYPIENLIPKDKVSIGYIMLDNKTFVHPSSFDKNRMDPIGIVCNVNKDCYKIISLDETKTIWATDFIKVDGLEKLKKEFYLDDRGKKYCEIINQCSESKTGIFPAVEWCLNYKTKGTKQGDWYLPACDELRHAILNIHIINAVIYACSYGVTVHTSSYYWSSSEYSSSQAWRAYTYNGTMYYNYKDYHFYVRAFLCVGGSE